jgi:ABC-type Fe3+-hydroxamate transport system substrate-binding protein
MAVTSCTDDLGFVMTPPRQPATRVVSLVPSLTEALAATNREAIVGATDFCTHPRDLEVPRVRGTKNPDTALIAELEPDIVIANREENRKLDVDRLRDEGVTVWVTDIRTVPQAIDSLRRMFALALGWDVPEWLHEASAVWAQPPPLAGRPAAIAVWRDPWMVVGSDTFTGDLAARVGLKNVYAQHADRYPHVTPDQILARGAELIVLPDEPYAFSPKDGPEAFPEIETVLVEGRLLTWYGPSLVTAHDSLRQAFGFL